MPIALLFLFLLAAFITAIISGIFGMAGGLIFMGIIASVLGVSEAMVVHGLVQSVSNSSRAFILKKHVRWDVFARIAIGAVPALILLMLAAYVPSKGVLFLALGVLPALLWLPRRWLSFDAQRPAHAVLCGFCVTGLNLVAGVAGPALDMFFIKTDMARQQIVATKAIIMLASHLMKILYFGIPMLLAVKALMFPPLWFFIAVIPLSIAGTMIGTQLLRRLSDVGFRSYTKYIVSVIGAVYLWRGAGLMGWL